MTTYIISISDDAGAISITTTTIGDTESTVSCFGGLLAHWACQLAGRINTPAFRLIFDAMTLNEQGRGSGRRPMDRFVMPRGNYGEQ